MLVHKDHPVVPSGFLDEPTAPNTLDPQTRDTNAATELGNDASSFVTSPFSAKSPSIASFFEVSSVSADACTFPSSLIVERNELGDGNNEEDSEGDESDQDNYVQWSVNPENSRTISQKKRMDQATLQNFAKAVSTDSPSKILDDLSAAGLIKKNATQIIKTPREYQIELFERAKNKNIIAVLDTGSGKTLIAALLLQYVLDKEINEREIGMRKRIAFFLVDKVSLVFQQHAVLECNLEHPVAKFCGEMVDSMWSHEFWNRQFEENKVIVCTAAILQKCLAHSYIRMEQINLLIFDEAHHTKKDHPYARIIKDYYVKEPDKDKRPKVFGMTASPVDAQTDVKVAAARLEGLLHSEIATISEYSISMNPHIRKITEKEVHYNTLPPPFETDLYRKISCLVRYNRHFGKELLFARQATSYLGSWLSDRLWQLFLTDVEILRLTNKTDMTYYGLDMKGEETGAVEKLRDVVKAHEFTPVTPTLRHLSIKVLRLWEELQARFSKPTGHKCIVFVDMRLTAFLLADLFKQDSIKIPYLNPAVLVGARSDGFSNTSLKEQILTIAKFRHGDVNCLFATQIAEEGIDIPNCNLVIRFDLYKSAIQYIQSKGRARQMDSEYLSFIEEGNGRHSRVVAQAMYDQSTLRRFCTALPEDRKIAGLDAEATILQGESHYKSYVIESTGAKLTWGSSLEVLAHFTASLRKSSHETLAPEYVIVNQGQYFVAEVQLPPQSPVLSIIGFPHKNKQSARCSAAFEMCKLLIKKRYIDHHLHSVFVKKLPVMRNARLAVSSNRRTEYEMRSKPEVWSRLGSFDVLFITVLKLETPAALGRISKPLIILTREQLPNLPTIPLFFSNNHHSEVHPVSLPTPIQISTSDSEALKEFTFRIFKDVFSKEYEASVADIPYFLAPTREDHSVKLSQIDDPASLIDWAHLGATKGKEYLDWNENTPQEFFKDKLVIDQYAGSRKFYLRGLRTDMKPTDLVPAGVPDPGHRAWRDDSIEKNIIEYSVSLWAKARQKRTWQKNQPVVEAEIVSLRRNLLDDSIKAMTEEQRICYVILEPLRVSTLPFEVAVMASTFPAIISRIDSVMIALDACKMLNLDIRPDLALEALTKDSDNSEEHDREKINFQSGMGNNYERLEFLGDCFLKMATTIAIFTSRPDEDEFDYHVQRMLLICNRNLFNKAVDKRLYEYVRSRSFDRRSWYPQGLQLKRGKQSQPANKHALGDKSIADVCEALIGAAYLTYADCGNFDMAIQAVTAMVKDKNHQMTSWSDYYAAYIPPEWQFRKSTAVQREIVRQIKNEMGYEFKSPALLRSAFKHPSYPKAYESLPNYQRLEFLGDALLDMVCVDFLFNKFPGADPQWLTEHKMAMVSNQFLASLCVKLGLHKHILIGTSAMLSQREEYVSSLNLAKFEAEDKIGDQDVFSQDYWTNVKHSPKYLSDVVEAYIGAVFVDSRYDFGEVRKFFDKNIRPFFNDMALYDSFASGHPVTKLGHILHERFGCREWRLMATDWVPSTDEGASVITGTRILCGVLFHGQVEFHATAESVRYAKVAAAKRALAVLEGMTESDYKLKFACDCKLAEAESTTELTTTI
ncbi:RNase3 domain protein [Colletotrichum truncatum]|uniref:RNase3 domain protein n=1 Tax=Colletotrichum truncatum TaxID=5467 RepID=A0ACC3YMK0_COLTU|nr:RNase3 domain protein [Colletotrichum truncatum]KAF6792219.1 RNase3 domain protein [Colletotrichum truncatum]